MPQVPTSSALVHPPGAPLRGPSAVVIRRWDDIADVEPDEWDAFLEPDDVQASHRFVRICQHSGVERARYRHLIMYQADTPVAIASLCAMNVRLELLASGVLRSAIHRLRSWSPALFRLPVAFAGLPVSFGRSCLRIRPGTDSRPLVAILADEFERWAAECGAGLVCGKEFVPEEVSFLAELEQQGFFRVPSLPFCTLPIRWRSFEDYLGDMRAGYRRQVLRSLRIREQVGLTVRVVDDVEPHCDRIFPLYEQVMDRAAIQLERLNPEFFRLLATECHPAARAVLVERDCALLAAAIVLETPGAHTFLLTGLDYTRHLATHSYISLVLELIARAIRAGVSRIDLGQTSYDLKRRLGAEVVPLELFLRYRSAWKHRLLRQASRVLFPARTLSPRRVFR